ncbi:AAA family ATPase [Tuanshanicoccus lijuaniae]|uniref:ATP-dependent Clp protease ATP-binding subunit n=1 Tax=Aerococcaceae bacterium zg-1292 TaxID=2774330 RepID=UPI001937B905|nr:AAA family ATPase [Aerococcaceae bacterium zg-1292]QQA37449.1 AAA family ATPase [Aerococcaceae bacterium zg-1292]
MEEKYSVRAAVVLEEAKKLAIIQNNPQVTELHVHLSLLMQDKSLIDEFFSKVGINKQRLIELVDNAVSHLDSNPGVSKLYFSRDYQKLLLMAEEIARSLYHSTVGTNHLFLALFKLEQSTSAHLLQHVGLEYQQCLHYFQELAEDYSFNEKYPQGISEVLKQYGRDLTQEARDGVLDPVIGMDDEINRVIQILSRRIKNNPILLGNPGVGKTAVVEGLAQRIVSFDVPDSLRNKIIFSLKLSDVIAGSKLRGEFEERLQEILSIVSNSNRRIIIFLDEIHTIVGTGASAGALDTSNILKPLLARGEVNVIGATTVAEYSKYIQKDGALERRFQKILLKQPSVDDTISILRGIKNKYEAYHGLKIKDEALIACAQLSDRYIVDRFLPDKAIDIMDEACSMVRTEIDAMPLELDELKRRLLQLQMEKVILQEETEEHQIQSNDSKRRLEELQDNILELSQKFDTEKQLWIKEKSSIDELRDIRKEIEKIELKIKEAQRSDRFEEVANYTQVVLPKLKAKNQLLLTKQYKYNILEEVNKEHIQEIISKATGIPLSDLKQEEIEKLLSLNDILDKRVIGQEQATKLVSNAIIRSKTGLKVANKPIATYLFMGPTGTGKTYLAKVLADTLFKTKESLVRLDMSEFMDKNSVSKLIGAPPGYVGYDEGGQLTEKIFNQPYSVVLFDEIEKANAQIYNLLLQILDEGHITDSKGRYIDFSNTIIILTSNIGARTTDESQEQSTHSDLLEHFNPEFINRLDGVIRFNSLDRQALTTIITNYIKTIEAQLPMEITLAIDDAAISRILEIANTDDYGAREVIRIIKNDIETLIALAILKKEVETKDTLHISIDTNKMFCLKNMKEGN